MADDKEYNLTCLIQGDKSTFSVLVSRDSEVNDLRRLIYKEGELDGFDFRLLDLIVLKVEIDLKSLQGRISQFTLGNRRHQSVDLDDSTLPLSELWEEQPPARHIHIFVQLPSRDGDPRKAEKKNEELEEAEDVRDQLVTRGLKRPRNESTSDNYEWHHGWRQLGDNDSAKRFGDCWRKQNVGTMRDSTSIALDYEGRGQEIPEDGFPLVRTTKNKIIVRNCYKDFYDHILKLRDNDYSGLVLTGQPGTGKTLWLLYALVRLLTENETVAYHSSAGTFLFFGNSVYSRISGKATKFPPAKTATFCLIDADREKGPVDTYFMTDAALFHKTFPVMASPPMPSRYSTWKKQRPGVPMEFMGLWTRDELKKGLEMQSFYDQLRKDVKTVLCSLSVDDSSTIAREDWRSLILSALEMIHGDDSMDSATGDDAMDDGTGDDATDKVVDEVLDKILDNAIEAYGLSARDVYEAISSPDLSENRINEALSGQTYETLRDTVLRIQQINAGSHFSHTIFSMWVTELPGPKTSVGFEVQFKSDWIKTKVLKHLEFLQHLDTAAMIKEMKAVPASSRQLAL